MPVSERLCIPVNAYYTTSDHILPNSLMNSLQYHFHIDTVDINVMLSL